ncbi:CAM kinase, SNF1 family, putative, partial [Eimeria tenella]
VDVWSFGVILYALLCGSLPFDDEHVPNLFKKIKHGSFTLPGHLSLWSRDLLLQMLAVDPSRRIRLGAIKSHPWFQELPQYLLLLRPAAAAAATPDALVLNQMAKLGYDVSDPSVFRRGLVGFPRSREAVAYQLLSDRRRKQIALSGAVAEELPTFPFSVVQRLSLRCCGGAPSRAAAASLLSLQ